LEHEQHAIPKTGIEAEVGHLYSAVDKLDTRLDRDFVTQKEYEPVRKIVYALVGLILTFVVVALLALVVRK
jgi:hypothetical protein